MPSGLLMMLYSLCVLGFFLCPSSTYLEQLLSSAEFFYMFLKFIYSFLFDLNILMVIQSYVLYSLMFFKAFFKIIGPVMSSFLYQIFFVLWSSYNNIIKFLKILKMSLVVFNFSMCFYPFKSFLGYIPSTSFVLSNMNKYTCYFLVSFLGHLIKLINFSIVLVISLKMALVFYILMNYKVFLKYVISVFILGIFFLVFSDLVQLSFVFSSVSFLMWLLYNFMVMLKHFGNYITSLSSFQLVISSVSLFSFSVYKKDQTNPLMKPPFIFSTYGFYFFCTVLLAKNIL